jgi:sugar O-acyltransferase (sialic acid O-acetyltransferase NeuD family)
MSQPLVIFGSGGFAREVHQVIEAMNRLEHRFDVLGYLDSNVSSHGIRLQEHAVLGDESWLSGHPDVAVAIGVGSPAARRKISMAVRRQGANPFATLVHPNAWMGQRVTIGEGTVVCAGTNVTCDVEIGAHVILNLNCTVGHDARIGPYANVNPGVNISGAVEVGEGCDLGTGATVIQGKSIGAWSVVGAGAVVVRDIPADVTAVGAPARPIKERVPGWHL